MSHPSLLKKSEPESCPTCQGPLAWRPLHRYPLVAQLVFGASFLIFIFAESRIRVTPALLWGWCALQVGLGVWLIYGRMQAKKRVLRCIRCSADLP